MTVLWFLVCGSAVSSQAQSIPLCQRERARFLELARQTETARQAGLASRAQDLERLAGHLTPQPLPPGWLEPISSPQPTLQEERAALLASAAVSLDPKTIARIEEWLIRHPWDSELRRLLLIEAHRAGDFPTARRHGSFLGEALPSRVGWWGKRLTLLMAVVLALQLGRLLWTIRRNS